jgi:hypothetical protein
MMDDLCENTVDYYGARAILIVLDKYGVFGNLNAIEVTGLVL